jgi:hypothetical protein
MAAPGKPGSDGNRCQHEFSDRELQVRWTSNNTRLEKRDGPTRASRHDLEYALLSASVHVSSATQIILCGAVVLSNMNDDCRW